MNKRRPTLRTARMGRTATITTMTQRKVKPKDTDEEVAAGEDAIVTRSPIQRERQTSSSSTPLWTSQTRPGTSTRPREARPASLALHRELVGPAVEEDAAAAVVGAGGAADAAAEDGAGVQASLLAVSRRVRPAGEPARAEQPRAVTRTTMMRAATTTRTTTTGRMTMTTRSTARSSTTTRLGHHAPGALCRPEDEARAVADAAARPCPATRTATSCTQIATVPVLGEGDAQAPTTPGRQQRRREHL